jgi:hypothetical protein
MELNLGVRSSNLFGRVTGITATHFELKESIRERAGAPPHDHRCICIISCIGIMFWLR